MTLHRIRPAIRADEAIRILMMSSIPLAAPWNGADKNLARLIVRADPQHRYRVQTGQGEPWPPHVEPYRLLSTGAMPTPRRKLGAFLYLLRYSSGMDLVHVVASLHHPSPWSSAVLRGWKWLNRVPLVHTVPSVGDGPVDPANFAGDVTVVVSEDTRRRLEAAGIRNVIRIMPPLDPDTVRPALLPSDVARAHTLGPRAVLYPAHYGPHSGIDTLLAALARLPAALDDVVAVIACRPQPGQNGAVEAEKLRGQAARAGVAPRVRVIETVTDMAALIAACAVTVLVPAKLASKMDLPMVILESLLLERPVIVTDRPPMNEALLGGAGAAVPYGDADALAATLSAMLAQPEPRRVLGKRAREAVLSACAPSCAIEQYHEAYRLALLSTRRERV